MISILYSDKIISLTNRANRLFIRCISISPKSMITIPTCVDINRFKYSEEIFSKQKKFSYRNNS